LNFHDPHQAIHALKAYVKQRPIHAVVGVDDATAVLAAVLSEALGLPHNAVGAVAAARNKLVMREALLRYQVRVPAFQACEIDDSPVELAAAVSYPCVIKPLTLSASCGVIRANDPQEFVSAFQRVKALLERLAMNEANSDGNADPGRTLLIEEFVAGPEVALEGLFTDGRLNVLALFDKPDPLEGPFFEETLYVTPSRLPDSVQATIAETAAHAAGALGLTEGPIHGELRTNHRGVWVIELAARSIGGRCSATLQFAAGTSLEELILRHALRLPLPALTRQPGAAGVMMLPIPQAGVLRKVGGEDKVREVPGIEEVIITAAVGQELVPLPEGTRYLGFLRARGTTPQEVEVALRTAHRCLEFVITPASEAAGVPPRTFVF
jgi:biotin carboxylase